MQTDPLPQVSEAEPKEAAPRPVYYFAWLGLWGTLERKALPAKGKRPPRQVYVLQEPHLGEVPLWFPKGARERIPGWVFQRNLGRIVLVHLAPRTDARGLWSARESQALNFTRKEEVKPPQFQARGRLVGVDLEEGLLLLEVRPNPEGLLKEPFRLTLYASLSLLEALPPVGSGVYLEGELRPKTRRLVVRRAEPAPLWDDQAASF